MEGDKILVEENTYITGSVNNVSAPVAIPSAAKA